MGQEGVGRVLMHQHEATMDRIERDIRLIAKGVGLDHVDPGKVRDTPFFRGLDQPRITIDAHNPTGRTTRAAAAASSDPPPQPTSLERGALARGQVRPESSQRADYRPPLVAPDAAVRSR